MIQLQTGNIFKNEFQNFKKYFKTTQRQKIYLNQISFDFIFDFNEIKQYNLKYFKVIAINKFENNFQQDEDTIKNNKSDSFIKSNNFKKEPNHPLFQKNNKTKKSIIDIQKKTQNIGKNVNLDIENYIISEKRTAQKTIENIIPFNQSFNNSLTFIINLNRTNNINDLEKSVYNFHIFAYDVDENIIDKISIFDQDIEKYFETELYVNSLLENIDNIKLNFFNDFNIIFDTKDENFEKQRTINLKFGSNLYKTLINYKKNNRKLINKIIITESLNGLILSTINIEQDIENISQFKFNTPINISDTTILTYLITIEYSNKKILSKELNHNVSNQFIKSKKNNEVIADNLLFKNIFKNIDVFFLQKEKLLQVNLQFNNISINKYFDPIFTSISFKNKELISYCFLDKEKNKKLNLFSKNIINLINENISQFYIDFSLANNFNIIVNQNLKIEIQKKFNIKDSFTYENKITVVSDNIFQNTNKVYAYLNYVNEKEEIPLNLDQSGLNLNYNLDITNLNQNIDFFSTKNKSLEKYLKSDYSQIISETKKTELEKNISLNQFYIIIKKNVLLENNIKNEYYYISPTNVNENNLSFNLSDYSLDQFKEIYSKPIDYKEIYFESKIMIIPSDLYEVNDCKSKRIIKNLVLQNKVNQSVIFGDDIIENIFVILKKINTNDTSSISDFDIEYLYRYFTLDYSYAKTNNKVLQSQTQIVQTKKNILLNNEIINIEFLSNKKTIKFNFDLNIEEVNRLNIQKEILFSSFNKLFKNKIFSFFYFKNNKDFNELYKTFFEKNDDCYYTNKKYLELINEINNFTIINYSFKTKNILNVEFEIDLNNTPMLTYFLKYCKNITRNLNLISNINIANNLYQVILIPNTNIQYSDINGNDIQIEILFSTNEIYLKYFDLSLI